MAEEAKTRSKFAVSALVFCVGGLSLGASIYSSGHGAGFEGWGDMLFGMLAIYGAMPLAAILGLISLALKERPFWLSLAATLMPVLVIVTLALGLWGL